MKHPKYTDCIETAVHLGREGCSCSEAVACAFGRKLGYPAEMVMAGSSLLAGGMLTGRTCGVAGAALFLLGLHFGPRTREDHAGRQRARLAGTTFLETFREQQGSTQCRDLCQGDIHSPEGAKAIRESGRPEQLIRCGAAILADLLAET